MRSMTCGFVSRVIACAIVLMGTTAATANAQSEEIEPRIVGRPGTTLIGFAGFLDRFNSSEDLFPTGYTVQVDVNRFISKKFVVRGGIVGNGTFGGESDDDDAPVGSGVPALHALVGLHYYFTPDSLMSLYTGAEYWAQITSRAERDSGSVLAKLGVHASVSSRAGLFAEAGVGTNLTRGDEDELVTRLVGQVGLRIRF